MSNRSPLHITSFDSTQRSFFEYIFDPEYGNFKMKMLIQENPKEKEIPFHYPSWLVDKVSILWNGKKIDFQYSSIIHVLL